MLALLMGLVLCGCSTLPDIDQQAASGEAPALLALQIADDDIEAEAEAPTSFRRVAPSRASVEQQQLLTVPVPGLVTPEPIVETEIAVMPEGLASIEVFELASELSDTKITFQRFDEFNEPRVFRIIGEAGDFYNVMVPMRPNGSTGWIRKSDVEVTSTDQRIQIDLSERSVIVWNGDDVVFDSIGTIGQDRTPTPVGSFYVRNVFEWYADSIYGPYVIPLSAYSESIYGPYVIPLSAYSESIDQINGGDAVVAIHGTQRPDLVGAAASLGCVRLDNETLRELAAIIEPGAPVDIIP